MSINAVNGNTLPSMLPQLPALGGGEGKGGAWEDFSLILGRQIKETDRLSKEAKETSKRALLGNAGVTLHEAQIAGAKADLHFRLMLQVRNKAVELYREIMTMPA